MKEEFIEENMIILVVLLGIWHNLNVCQMNDWLTANWLPIQESVKTTMEKCENSVLNILIFLYSIADTL